MCIKTADCPRFCAAQVLGRAEEIADEEIDDPLNQRKARQSPAVSIAQSIPAVQPVRPPRFPLTGLTRVLCRVCFALRWTSQNYVPGADRMPAEAAARMREKFDKAVKVRLASGFRAVVCCSCHPRLLCVFVPSPLPLAITAAFLALPTAGWLTLARLAFSFPF